MNVAIFARVSTNDGRQNTSRQIKDLQKLCDSQGWTVHSVITENISGAKRNDKRQGLQELFSLAASGVIGKVVITEVSRLGRSVKDGIDIIEKLNALRVSIYIQNIGMETLLHDGKPNFMFKPILMTLIGFAEMERELLRERIKSGLKEAKRQGRSGGRRKGYRKSDEDILKEYPKVVKEVKQNNPLSLRKIAKLCDCSVNTVQKVKSILNK